MKKVLFISPTWVGIHLDIKQGLKDQGFECEFLPELDFAEDPYKVKSKHPYSLEKADSLKTDWWRKNLSKTKTVFDYLLVIDGEGINPFLFEELRQRNPAIYCVNYLYDTTYSLYHFEKSFQFFDRVLTFDKKDAEKYNLELLPIYWINKYTTSNDYNNTIFGFGAYSSSRMRLYSQIADIAEKKGISHFIKLYHKKIPNLLWYRIYLFIRKLFGMPPLMTIQEYQSGMISEELISPSQYRSMIQAADVVLDTKVLAQDGLTARFMWALGLGKKIITTNEAAKGYDFFSKEQILIVEDKIFDEQEKKRILDFICCPSQVSSQITSIVNQFRLDNWLKFLLKSKETVFE